MVTSEVRVEITKSKTFEKGNLVKNIYQGAILLITENSDNGFSGVCINEGKSAFKIGCFSIICKKEDYEQFIGQILLQSK